MIQGCVFQPALLDEPDDVTEVGGQGVARAQQRPFHLVEQRVTEEYPRRLGEFRDHDGRPPRHSFFYPIEEYEPQYLSALADLGEVEVHLHHDHDTSADLRRKLLDFKHLLCERHSLLSRNRHTGDIVYGFVHGN